MKGAIGNAFILNLVITFMLIFFSLLIGSMAYSKAYKTKDYLINMIDKYEIEGKTTFYAPEDPDGQEWDNEVNEYLGRIGYIISDKNEGCPNKGKYGLLRNTNKGYDYCIYKRYDYLDDNPLVARKYNYMVLVYMKFDIPILGEFIKIPITGETKAYIILR